MGVKTGMRLNECRVLCPQIIPIVTHPAWYRQVHVDIMAILTAYCDDVLVKSIDEAAMNLSSYKWVYKDIEGLAKQIKADIKAKYDYLTCSIGIAANSFLAKLGTELQKPDGLIHITQNNIDTYLGSLKLTDLPGIAKNNEKRLLLTGIRTPLEMRYSSPALLRKVFGGINGDYWHNRLNFKEVDLYSNATRSMSAMRTVSRQQRENCQSLESLLISLCTRLEQRMVKNELFCKEVSFYIRNLDRTGWETKIRFAEPVQDGLELRKYIKEKIQECEKSYSIKLFGIKLQSMGVVIGSFVSNKVMQYSLFNNRMKHDILRKTVYNIKDKYGKNSVRKACELFEPNVMKDAIGFGSVKDMVIGNNGEVKNKYLLEETF